METACGRMSELVGFEQWRAKESGLYLLVQCSIDVITCVLPQVAKY